MATQSTFSTQLSAWARKTQARQSAIWKESSKRVVSLAQSRIPIDLGFARASVRASIGSMPPIDASKTNKERQAGAYDSGEITLVIAGAQPGQVLYIGWTAAYVLPLEYGHSQQAPSGFVRISAMEWPRIVKQVTAEAKQRASAGP